MEKGVDFRSIASDGSRQQKTVQAMVADTIRSAILQGTIEAGQPLKQDIIAADLGVSKIPVREALKQLEGEGLITLRPYRSAIVSELSYAGAVEIGEIRIALESLALRLALPNLTKETLQQVKDILQAIDMDEHATNFHELNWEFHKTLLLPAGRPLLLQMIESLHTNFQRYTRVYSSAMNLKSQAQEAHRQIFIACERRHPGAAVQGLERDIKGVVDAFDVLISR